MSELYSNQHFDEVVFLRRIQHMNFLRLFPVVLSLLVLGAHFSRAGLTPFVLACLALVLLLPVPRPWVARVIQFALLLGTLEWLRTLFVLVRMRSAMGEPWLRLALILGTVAAVTLASALAFQSRSLRQRYGLDQES